MDAQQKQVIETFQSMWDDVDTYSVKKLKSEISRLDSWSDLQLSRILSDSLALSSPNLKLLDAGCGLGHMFLAFSSFMPNFIKSIDYSGLDLISLENAQTYLTKSFPSLYEHISFTSSFINDDMMSFCNSHQCEFDVVLALGTLHHTPNIYDYLCSTFSSTSPNGIYICWITKEQPPLRQVTDLFFREYFQGLDSSEDVKSQLQALSALFGQFSSALGSQSIVIPDDIPSLDITAGTYLIQQLVYDFIFKCYYNNSETPERNANQLFDWFMPSFYHETTSSQLDNYLNSLSDLYHHRVLDCISKDNGHFFVLQRLD